MLKRMMFGLVPSTVTRGIIAWCMLLLLALTPSLVACASPTSASVPAPTPTPTVALPAAPPAFQIADLAINPAEVNPGEKVTITAQVTNTGDIGGSYAAKLGINNIAGVLRNVTVPAGGTQTLSFSVSKDIPGTYRVTLGELSGQFMVAEPVELTQPSGPKIATAPSCCSPKPTSTPCCCSPKPITTPSCCR